MSVADRVREEVVRGEVGAVFPNYAPHIPFLWLPVVVPHDSQDYVNAVAMGPSRMAGIILGHAARRAQDLAAIGRQVADRNFGVRVSWVPTTRPELFAERTMPPQDGLAVATARLNVRGNQLRISASRMNEGTSQIEYINNGTGHPGHEARWQPNHAHIVGDQDGVVMPVDGYVHAGLRDDPEARNLTFGAAAYKMGQVAAWAAEMEFMSPDTIGVTVEFHSWPHP